MHYLADLLFVILWLRYMYILSHQTSTDLSLYKSKSRLLYDYNNLKIYRKNTPYNNRISPCRKVWYFDEVTHPFRNTYKFFQVNKEIRNVFNTFRLSLELAGTSEQTTANKMAGSRFNAVADIYISRLVSL